MGSLISFLMPMGLAFLGAAALAWGAALVSMRGRTRVGGAIALACGVAVMLAAGVSLGSGDMLGLMLALLGSAAWAITAGVVLASWRTHAR
jgi:drug/metabolite transporter (DMT)-like permease